jgi:hypothetical protein
LAGRLRALSHARLWNIAARTAHIGVTGVLFGGHVFGIEARRLMPWLYAAILTGAVLLIIEAYPKWRWCYQGRAVMVVTKVLMLCLVPWCWDYRVVIIAAVIVLGSAGSHMPRRFRYYSFVERTVVDSSKSST